MDGILEVAGLNGEEGRRLERVAKARPSLTNPEPGQLKQLALWAGILPDPIEQTTSPRACRGRGRNLGEIPQWQPH